jgi:SAM-dependent methyltransferase
VRGRPRRFCPHCEAEESIGPGEDLWPRAWRCARCGQGLPQARSFVALAPEIDDEHDGFDLANFDFLPEIEAEHFWFVSRNELISWLTRRFAPAPARALEVGCGTGFVLFALRDALPKTRLVGSELHTLGLQTARKRHGDAVELFQMDARQTHLAESVDLVGAFDVLEHIPQDEAVLAEIFRVLAPGGVLIATVPQHPWMWSAEDDLAKHQRRYCRGELARKAAAAGLEPVYQTSFTTLAFPLMVASRLLARLKATSRTLAEQTEAEFELSPGLSRVLLALARLEQVLRKCGVPLPFGGSQVLVARRPIEKT